MYVPDAFRLDDSARMAAVMRAFDFALLVTAPDGAVQASHLPFLYDPDAGENGMLHAHMARANPQWRDFETLAEAGQEALVIFQGPHAYISPTWYGGDTPQVPTWNYVAVHAYGLPRIVEGAAEKRALLDRLVATHEAALAAPWSTAGLTEAYMEGMLRGLVAFEIPVTRLEAKAKLSQNKPTAQLAAATAVLEQAVDPTARATGEWMRQALEAKG
ncbi:MAG: FMN-binding negative transcriptional regulator [Kiloniellaceae bacterium]